MVTLLSMVANSIRLLDDVILGRTFTSQREQERSFRWNVASLLISFNPRNIGESSADFTSGSLKPVSFEIQDLAVYENSPKR